MVLVFRVEYLDRLGEWDGGGLLFLVVKVLETAVKMFCDL